MAKEIIIDYAEEAKRIAEELIPQYHDELVDARVLYLFTTQKRKKCDRVRLGSAKKFGAMERFLSSKHFTDVRSPSTSNGADFMILLDHEEWEELKTPQRVALVDHELCHCGRFEKIVKDSLVMYWGLRGHDVEEFSCIIQRHGLWQKDLETMHDTMRQLALPLA